MEGLMQIAETFKEVCWKRFGIVVENKINQPKYARNEDAKSDLGVMAKYWTGFACKCNDMKKKVIRQSD